MVFDKDGTLIDAHATWAPVLQETVTQFAHGDTQVQEQIYAILGMCPDTMTFSEKSAFMIDSNEMCRRRLYENGVDGLALYRVMDSVCAEMLASSVVPLFSINNLFDKVRASWSESCHSHCR